MKAEWKKKWIAALRSGDYEQGSGQLRPSNIRYCCLGVLADLAVQEGIGEWSSHGDYSFGGGLYDKLLPRNLEERIGFFILRQTDLVTMNDNGESFSRIADWIEANVPTE